MMVIIDRGPWRCHQKWLWGLSHLKAVASGVGTICCCCCCGAKIFVCVVESVALGERFVRKLSTNDFTPHSRLYNSVMMYNCDAQLSQDQRRFGILSTYPTTAFLYGSCVTCKQEMWKNLSHWLQLSVLTFISRWHVSHSMLRL